MHDERLCPHGQPGTVNCPAVAKGDDLTQQQRADQQAEWAQREAARAVELEQALGDLFDNTTRPRLVRRQNDAWCETYDRAAKLLGKPGSMR